MSAQRAGERADAQEAARPALRRRRRLTCRQRNAIVFGIIGLAFLIPLRGLLRSQGPPMEEGFMLVFPERLLHGDLPNRDFLHLYGPGSLWVLAGVYKVFGTSLTAERLVALLQQLGVVALGASPYAIQLATAGVGATVSGMILDPVIYLRGGRRLPIPPPWDHLDGFLQRAGNIQQLSWPVPSFSTAQQLTTWFFFLLATVLFLLLVARWRLRQNRTAFNPRVLATVAVFSLGLMPQAIQRVDSAHFAWVGCVPIAFLPIAVTEVLRSWRPRLHVRARNVLDGGGVLVFLFAVLPYFTIRTYTDYSLQSFGYHRIAYKIEHKGRIFYYGRPEAARAANELLPVADRISKPGDRLFVGPTDLRKTPYSDAYLYYMLPDLDPATYYIEMDPGVANGSGSRLASDLRSADIAILSSVWNDWDEPNDARKFGSNRPNEILKRDFCLVDTFGRGGVYELYRRCNK